MSCTIEALFRLPFKSSARHSSSIAPRTRGRATFSFLVAGRGSHAMSAVQRAREALVAARSAPPEQLDASLAALRDAVAALDAPPGPPAPAALLGAQCRVDALLCPHLLCRASCRTARRGCHAQHFALRAGTAHPRGRTGSVGRCRVARAIITRCCPRTSIAVLAIPLPPSNAFHGSKGQGDSAPTRHFAIRLARGDGMPPDVARRPVEHNHRPAGQQH